MEGPPSPTPEEEPEDKFSLVRKSHYYEEYDEPVSQMIKSPGSVYGFSQCVCSEAAIHFSFQLRRRSFSSARAIPHVVRPVDDITQTELQNICNNVREKVYNSSTVSLSFNPKKASATNFWLKAFFEWSSGNHLPPVPPEDNWHQDQLS